MKKLRVTIDRNGITITNRKGKNSSSFSLDLSSSSLKTDVSKSQKRTAKLACMAMIAAVNVRDAMNKLSVCRRIVYYVMGQPFLLFIRKELTNMVALWGDQIRCKKEKRKEKNSSRNFWMCNSR